MIKRLFYVPKNVKSDPDPHLQTLSGKKTRKLFLISNSVGAILPHLGGLQAGHVGLGDLSS